ncbi:MAG: hypothetical protein WDM80_18310 [Limisphaerales bacterium]
MAKFTSIEAAYQLALERYAGYGVDVSQRLSKTTGQIITVDGGLHEAFLR